MENEVQRELELLPSSARTTATTMGSDSNSSSLLRLRSTVVSSSSTEGSTPSLDLQLSISVRPMRPPAADDHCVLNMNICDSVEALKWQAAEQIRLAAMEKAYAERVRELTRREMEMAQSEFARARQMWERAREEVEKAERIKERATSSTSQVDSASTCMQITCHSCRQRFTPA